MESYSDMQSASFDKGREDAFKEMEEMCRRVTHKLDQRRNYWKQRVADGMEADVLLLYTTLQYDFYRELGEWLADENNEMRKQPPEDSLNLAE